VPAALSTASYGAGCQGQKGSVIFEDTFSDDTGGWAQPIDGVVPEYGPEPKVHLKAPNSGYVWYNNTFNASEGDYCIEFVWPKPLAPDKKAYVALAFWASDYANLYLVQVDSGGGINLWRKSGGTWATIGDLSNPKVKPVPGSLVTLRVVAKGNLIVPILDGVELKKTRAQMPAGDLKFGLFIQDDTAVPDAVITPPQVFGPTSHCPVTLRRILRPGLAWPSAPRCRSRTDGRRSHPRSSV